MNMPSTAEEAIAGGFIAFGLASFFGARLLLRGFRNDVNDSSGHLVAGRAWFIAGGILCQVPLIMFCLFVWRQGFSK
jgi:hypothetical protein